MPSIIAGTLVDKAEIVLQDTSNVHWSAAELLGWLNDGQREAAILKPSVCVQTKSWPLAAGARQVLGADEETADAEMLLQVHCNMGTDGDTPGDAINLVSREQLAAQNPSWRSADEESEVEDYVFDVNMPLVFYVSPPNDGTGYVELSYFAVPAEVELADPISISDLYATALVDYILYRAYSKDAKHGQNAQRAVTHFNLFQAALGASAQQQAANSPQVELHPHNPAQPAGAK